ncbi:MAG: amino acid adenylation domain-containing protein, partial [Gammaproteobacteria bacterium]
EVDTVAARIETRLNEQLPTYMVPSATVVLDALPLTANGKVDVRALPAPDYQDGKPYVAPQTPTQIALAQLWSELLDVEQISIDASFFELGGHSLLATRLINAIAQRMDRVVKVRALFDYPTVAALAMHVDELAPQTATRIKPRAPDLPARLSIAQQRLWFIDRLEEGSAQFNIPRALVLKGRLDRDALAHALDSLVARHEVFRTTLSTGEGDGIQVVHPPYSVDIDDIDLSTAVSPQSAAQHKVAELSRKPFDLEQDFLLRCALIRIGADEHALLFVFHHIIFDEWSTGIFVREFAAAYRASVRGAALDLPPMRVQYADFAQWQRDHFNAERMQRETTFWKERLENAAPLHSLPTDFARPAVPDRRAASYHHSLDTATSEAVLKLAEHFDVTPFILLETAFAILIGRYSRRQDVSIGTPIAGRTHEDAQALIGFFVNTLVLRTAWDETMSFADVLHENRSTILDAHANQTLPFERLVDELAPQRTLSHSPLFQIMFSMQNTAVPTIDLPDLAVSPMGTDFIVAKHDLRVTAVQTKTGLALNWLYATSLFSETSMRRLGAAFGQLLKGIVADPHTAVATLPLQTAADRETLAALNDPQPDDDVEGSVHSWFECVAQANANRAAVADVGRSLTYAELNARANQLGRYLRTEQLAGGERPIVVAIDRCVEVMIAVLATLKTGSAFVLVNPDSTQARLQQVVEDCDARCILSLDRLAPSVADATTIAIDTLEHLETLAQDNLELDHRDVISPLCYVCFTSGSTGRPKGVEVDHASLLAYLRFATDTYYGVHLDGSLVATSPAFDITFPALFLPLLNGDCVHFLGADDVIGELADRLNTTQQSFLLRVTPTHMRAALPLISEQPDARHAFVIGGEAFPVDLANALHRTFDASSVFNHYGPTEAVIGSTLYNVSQEDLTGLSTLPIGSPMANMTVSIVDENNGPVPSGGVGELLIGGASLARGYRGRAELTAAKFVCHPDLPCSPMYRSGDLVRLDAHNRLTFVGRADQQLKINGFRVEPGEIEYHLRRLPGIATALVTDFTLGASVKALVAYVVPQVGRERPSDEDVRLALREVLPDYMVPARLVALEALPQTPNGKIDRSRLPPPDHAEQGVHVAAKTPLEKTIAEIWGEVLDLDDISMTADFFALGGHSLLATRVATALHNRCDRKVPIRTLFEHRTIGALARWLEASEVDAYQSIAVAPRDAPLPQSFAQQRLWFIDQLGGGSVQYNQTRALRFEGNLNAVALTQALNAIVSRHEVLRTVYADIDGQGVQIVNACAEVSIANVDLSTDVDSLSAVKAFVREEKTRPFDLRRDPMLRCSLLTLGREDHVLVLSVHHITSDGWSTGLLVKELTQLYTAFCTETRVELPPLPVQYADYAVWQRSDELNQSHDAQLDYWRERLEGVPPVHSLPLDRPRPRAIDHAAGLVTSRVDIETLERLLAIGSRENATLFMVLQAALAVVIGRYSHSADIVVGTPVAGRVHRDTENLIGHFLNSLVFRTQLNDDDSFQTLLRQVRDDALGAYANQTVPFESLVDALNPMRDLGVSPIFQIKFVLQNYASSALKLPAIKASQMVDHWHTVHFDLDLTATQRSEGLALQWTYRLDLFERTTVERVALSFVNLLNAIAEAPERGIYEQPLTTAQTDRALIAAGQGTDYNNTAPATIIETFEEQVQTNPDAVATFGADGPVSYARLNSLANRLAHGLTDQGVESGDVVGIVCGPAAESLIAMLGAMKAGAAYVPLDALGSLDRTARIVQDAGIEWLLTLASALPNDPIPGVDVLPLDDALTNTQWLAEYSDSNPPCPDLQSLAYLIYTSGSTGTPKGVEVEHGALATYCRAARGAYYDDELDGALVITSTSFDISVPSLYLPLLSGGFVRFPRDNADLAELTRSLMQSSERLLLRLPPARAMALFDLTVSQRVTSRPLLVLGREALDYPLANRL